MVEPLTPTDMTPAEREAALETMRIALALIDNDQA